MAAGTAGLIALDRQITRGLPNSEDQIKWGNRVSHAGGLYTLGAVTVVPVVIGKWGERPGAMSVARGSIDSLAASLTVNYALKYSFGRERPDAGVGNGPFFSGGDSFPSGHTMNIWAVCTAIARHKKTPKWAKTFPTALPYRSASPA